MSHNLIDCLQQIQQPRILVLGDLILDLLGRLADETDQLAIVEDLREFRRSEEPATAGLGACDRRG